MGLAERRVIKEFQDTKYPELKKAIDDAAGFPVEMDVQWDTLALEGSSHLFLSCFPKIYFQPLIDGFTSICKDDMGKEALKGALKKVVICNVKGKHSETGITFANGILEIDHLQTSNVDNVKDRTKGVIKVLEKSL